MKIISYSDLHLEFGSNFMPPADTDADVMILAGDICREKLTAWLEDGKSGSRVVISHHAPVIRIAHSRAT